MSSSVVAAPRGPTVLMMLGTGLATLNADFSYSTTVPLSSVRYLHGHKPTAVCQESGLGFAACYGSGWESHA